MTEREPGWITEPRRLRYAAFDYMLSLDSGSDADWWVLARYVGRTALSCPFSLEELQDILDLIERRAEGNYA